MGTDLRLIYHFVIVAEERSFTRAAARLSLAQPWLSQRIRALEEQLGVALFARTPRQLHLTRAGELLYDTSAPLVALSGEIAATARNLQRLDVGKLRVGAPPYGGRIAARNRMLTAVAERWEVEMEVGWSPQLRNRVADGQLDAAFVVHPIDEEGLHVVQIAELKRVLVFETGDPLRGAGPILASELAHRAVAVFPRGVNEGLFDAVFLPLVLAGAELVPTEFDGRVIKPGNRPGPVISSYFTDSDPDATLGERPLDESQPLAFSFITRLADSRAPTREMREMATTI
jgi:DNA-binding transcriptional LysR family regulator